MYAHNLETLGLGWEENSRVAEISSDVGNHARVAYFRAISTPHVQLLEFDEVGADYVCYTPFYEEPGDVGCHLCVWNRSVIHRSEEWRI